MTLRGEVTQTGASPGQSRDGGSALLTRNWLREHGVSVSVHPKPKTPATFAFLQREHRWSLNLAELASWDSCMFDSRDVCREKQQQLGMSLYSTPLPSKHLVVIGNFLQVFFRQGSEVTVSQSKYLGEGASCSSWT